MEQVRIPIRIDLIPSPEAVHQCRDLFNLGFYPTTLMRLIHPTILAALLLVLSACQPAPPDKEKLKGEIKAVEAAFRDAVNAKGAGKAFAEFAAEGATVRRENDTLIHGKEAIERYHGTPFFLSAKADWAPDFIDVSDDGTMAYSYGRYHWDYPDSSGQTQTLAGGYMTIWKRQADGSWKYVWD